jgi:hypothetical protein
MNPLKICEENKLIEINYGERAWEAERTNPVFFCGVPLIDEGTAQGQKPSI